MKPNRKLSRADAMGRGTGVAVAAIALLVSGCAGGAASTTANGSSSPTGVQQGATCAYPVSGSPSKPVDPPPTTGVANTGTASASLHFASGMVNITLNQKAAPCTVNSFLSLAQQGYFNNTKCHRLVTSGIFILQCGDPTGTGTGGPGYSFADELTGQETYPKGTVAMANAGPNANGSQFFLVWADTPLNPAYTVFGTMDAASVKVVEAMAAQGVTGADQSTPVANTTITSVSLG